MKTKMASFLFCALLSLAASRAAAGGITLSDFKLTGDLGGNIAAFTLTANAKVEDAKSSGVISPEISYQWQGGFSKFQKVTVEINSNGMANVLISQKSARQAKIYSTTLNADEIGQLNQLLRTADLFHFNNVQTMPSPTDAGLKTIIAKLPSNRREFSYSYEPALQPLEVFMGMLITQADLMDKQEEEQVYALLGAIDPHLAAAKVLQPYAFKQPVINSMLSQTNSGFIGWQLETLSFLSSTQELANVAARGLNSTNAEVAKAWLAEFSTRAYFDNLSGPYQTALLSVAEEQNKKFTRPVIDTGLIQELISRNNPIPSLTATNRPTGN